MIEKRSCRLVEIFLILDPLSIVQFYNDYFHYQPLKQHLREIQKSTT